MSRRRWLIGIGRDRRALLGPQDFEQLFDRVEAFAIIFAARRRRNFTQSLIVREERGDRRISMHDDANPRPNRVVKSRAR